MNKPDAVHMNADAATGPSAFGPCQTVGGLPYETLHELVAPRVVEDFKERFRCEAAAAALAAVVQSRPGAGPAFAAELAADFADALVDELTRRADERFRARVREKGGWCGDPPKLPR